MAQPWEWLMAVQLVTCTSRPIWTAHHQQSIQPLQCPVRRTPHRVVCALQSGVASSPRRMATEDHALRRSASSLSPMKQKGMGRYHGCQVNSPDPAMSCWCALPFVMPVLHAEAQWIDMLLSYTQTHNILGQVHCNFACVHSLCHPSLHLVAR